MKNFMQFVFMLLLCSACNKKTIDFIGNDFSDEETNQQLRSYIDNLGEAGHLHGGALVAKDGMIIYEKAFGESTEGQQNTVESLFNSASIGKNFTGVAIMQLVQQDKLNLNDYISDHLPNYGNQENANRISIEHLLTHRSGIRDIFSSSVKGELDNATIEEFKDYFPYFENNELEFTPGKKFSYSNSGYLVLGAIIEAVTKQSYCEYLQSNIFEPAGMSSVECGMPMGGNQSTLKDLIVFTNTLYNNELLDEFHTQLVTTGLGRITQEMNDSFYAYGFEVDQNEFGKCIYHKGGTENLKAILAHYPISGYTTIHYHNNNKIGYQKFLESIDYLKELLWK